MTAPENWPTASCCGEPRVTKDVDRCYDHAKVCQQGACTEPSEDGMCPQCAAIAALRPDGTQALVLTVVRRGVPRAVTVAEMMQEELLAGKTASAINHALRALHKKGLVSAPIHTFKSEIPRDWEVPW